MSFFRAQKVLKFEFAVEEIIMFIKNIKKTFEWYVHFIGKSVIWTIIIFFNFLFLRAQKVLKFEFTVEAITLFIKNIKKALSGMFTLLISKQYEL